uniref:Uncharacterized protein n=1 Tax=Photinus pyralis TaxID=7054 RepID=A0A1Y1MYU0_PHOPY
MTGVSLTHPTLLSRRSPISLMKQVTPETINHPFGKIKWSEKFLWTLEGATNSPTQNLKRRCLVPNQGHWDLHLYPASSSTRQNVPVEPVQQSMAGKYLPETMEGGGGRPHFKRRRRSTVSVKL